MSVLVGFFTPAETRVLALRLLTAADQVERIGAVGVDAEHYVNKMREEIGAKDAVRRAYARIDEAAQKRGVRA